MGAAPDANGMHVEPSLSDARVAPSSSDAAVTPNLDAGTSATVSDAGREASTPLDAAGVMDSTTAGDASNDAALLDGGTLDSGLASDSGSDASQPGADAEAGVSAPTFQKTRCIDPSKVKADSELNFPCDGVDVWVVVPRQCFAETCGLVFNIHGGGMSDHATMDQATDMIALGSRAGYIVVHPHKGTWSVASDKNVVFALMQQVIQAFAVDPKRVHATGYSQGGQISWALGCEHADVVASIAPTEEINRVSDCWKTSKLPARALSVLFAYGKQDSIGGGYTAAQQLARQFAMGHGMTGPETIAGSEGSKYWRQRWRGSQANVLEFISQDYTSSGVLGILDGHCLPMATGKTFVSCSTPVDYNWGEEVIRFFQAHPMP
jgi:poly(3-hydroxybutyrate) depolymerase